LNLGECVDPDAVDAAYDEWFNVTGGLEKDDRGGWTTSGYGSFHKDTVGELCYEDFGPAQLEGYYGAYYVETGYKLPIKVNIGFVGFYLFGDKVMNTSFYWQNLEKDGDCIDWEALDVAYAGWVARGGLPLPDNGSPEWKTSGYAPLFINHGDDVCWGDLADAQKEGYYRAYYMSPGYDQPE